MAGILVTVTSHGLRLVSTFVALNLGGFIFTAAKALDGDLETLLLGSGASGGLRVRRLIFFRFHTVIGEGMSVSIGGGDDIFRVRTEQAGGTFGDAQHDGRLAVLVGGTHEAGLDVGGAGGRGRANLGRADPGGDGDLEGRGQHGRRGAIAALLRVVDDFVPVPHQVPLVGAEVGFLLHGSSFLLLNSRSFGSEELSLATLGGSIHMNFKLGDFHLIRGCHFLELLVLGRLLGEAGWLGGLVILLAEGGRGVGGVGGRGRGLRRHAGGGQGGILRGVHIAGLEELLGFGRRGVGLERGNCERTVLVLFGFLLIRTDVCAEET